MQGPNDIDKHYRNVKRIKDAGFGDDAVKEYLSEQGLNGLPPRAEKAPAKRPTPGEEQISKFKKMAETTPKVADWMAQSINPLGTFNDEIQGAVRGPKARDEYNQNVQDVRDNLGGLAIPAEIAMGAKSGVGLLGAAKAGKGMVSKAAEKFLGGSTAKTVAGRVAGNAGRGAAFGAISGAGSGDDVESRWAGTKKGALVGGSLGGLLSLGGDAFTAGHQKYQDWKETHDPTRVAAGIYRDRIKQDGVKVMREFADAPDDAVAGDLLGPYGAAELRAASGKPTEEGGLFRKEMADRTKKRDIPVVDRLNKDLPDPNLGPMGHQERLDQIHKPAVDAAYDATRHANPQLMWDQMPSLRNDNPITKEALAFADGMSAKGGQASDGISHLDLVKRGYDGIISKGMRAGDMNSVRLAQNLKDQLIEDLDRAALLYPEARGMHHQWQSEKEALAFGEKFASSGQDPKDFQLALHEAVPSLKGGAEKLHNREAVLDAASHGVALKLRNIIQSGNGDNSQQLISLFGGENAEEITKLAFRDPKDFSSFQKEALRRLKEVTRERMLTGDAKAEAVHVAGLLHGTSPWAIGRALAGNPLLVGSQMLKSAVEAGATKASRKAAPELVRMARTPLKIPGTGRMDPKFLKLLKDTRELPPVNPTRFQAWPYIQAAVDR